MRYRQVPNYRPFYQSPYCCVPATLQWILYRHGLDILDQETIGAELGLRLPEKGREFFTNKKIIYLSKEPADGFGTQIEKKQYSIQNFFDKFNIPLEISEMYLLDRESELRNFLIDNISKKNDIIMRYNSEVLRRENQKSCGHFSVITEFDDKSNMVSIGDSEMPHFKKASLGQIIYSISDKPDGIQRGFYVVSAKTI